MIALECASSYSPGRMLCTVATRIKNAAGHISRHSVTAKAHRPVRSESLSFVSMNHFISQSTVRARLTFIKTHTISYDVIPRNDLITHDGMSCKLCFFIPATGTSARHYRHLLVTTQLISLNGKKTRITMKIISGGQTGVDQAALRVAESRGLELGGWCPPGMVCESGPIPERFPLRETPGERSVRARDVPRSLRTEWNVRDSDATLVLRRLIPTLHSHSDPGTTWTFECAILYGKPLLLCDVSKPADANVKIVRTWLDSLKVGTLNVAGPAESAQLGIGRLAEEFLLKVFE